MKQNKPMTLEEINNFYDRLLTDKNASKIAIEQIRLNYELSLMDNEAYTNSEASRKTPLTPKELKPPSDIEVDHNRTKGFQENFNREPSVLAYASKKKNLVLICCMLFLLIPEYIVYQAIGENILKLGDKSWLFALSIIGVCKTLAILKLRHYKNNIKDFKAVRKYFFTSYMVALVILILVQVAALGFLNAENQKQAQLTNKYRSLSMALIDAEEKGYDTTELEAKVSSVQKELSKDESWFMKLVRNLAIILLSVMILLCSSFIYVLYELMADALRLKQKLLAMKKKLELIRANIIKYPQEYATTLSLERELIGLFGQKRYLEKLISLKYVS